MPKKHIKTASKKINISDEDPVHVMIASPLNLRKLLLSGALDINLVIRSYSDLMEIRELKKNLINSFYSLTNDANKIINDLKKYCLPSVLMNEEGEKTKVMVDSHNYGIKNTPEAVSDSEIERLKVELRNIESKLSGL